MTSLPIHLLDNQSLVAALLRIQSMTPEPNSAPPKPQVPEYVATGLAGLWSFTVDGSSYSGNTSRVSNHHELGKTIAAELWARGVLRLQLPDVERVLRDAEALIKEATP